MLSWKLGDRLAEETARAMLSEVCFGAPWLHCSGLQPQGRTPIGAE